MFFDTKHKVKSFEELGLLDPFGKKSLITAVSCVKKFNYKNTSIYPKIMDVVFNAMWGVKYASPPKMSFIPDKKTLRGMVKAVLKYGSEPPDVFFLRFGILSKEILDMSEEAFRVEGAYRSSLNIFEGVSDSENN